MPSDDLSLADTQDFLKRLGLWDNSLPPVEDLSFPPAPNLVMPNLAPPRVPGAASSHIAQPEGPTAFAAQPVDPEPRAEPDTVFLVGSPVIAEAVPGAPALPALPGAVPSLAAPPTKGQPSSSGGAASIFATNEPGADAALTSDISTSSTETLDATGPHRPMTWEELFETSEPEAWPDVDEEVLEGQMLNEFTVVAAVGPTAAVKFRESVTPKDDFGPRRYWPYAAAIVAFILVAFGATRITLGRSPKVSSFSSDQLITNLRTNGSALTTMRFSVDDEIVGIRSTTRGVTDFTKMEGEYTVEERGATTKVLRRSGEIGFEQRPSDGTKWWPANENDVTGGETVGSLLRYPTDLVAFLEMEQPGTRNLIGIVNVGSAPVRNERFLVRMTTSDPALIGPARFKAIDELIDGDLAVDVWYDGNGRLRSVRLSGNDMNARTLFFTTDFSQYGTPSTYVRPADTDVATASSAENDTAKTLLTKLGEKVSRKARATTEPDFASITAEDLREVEPGLIVVDASAPVEGTNSVGLANASDAVTLAVKSVSNTCFLLKLSATQDSYAQFVASADTPCAAATPAEWLTSW